MDILYSAYILGLDRGERLWDVCDSQATKKPTQIVLDRFERCRFNRCYGIRRSSAIRVSISSSQKVTSIASSKLPTIEGI